MKITLLCTECHYKEAGSSEKPLMNKIIMWNHVKRAHAGVAERLMRMYTTMPSEFYVAR